MSDQTEGAGREPPGDESFSWSLRPRRLAEYIGQVQVVDNLGIALAAAKSRQEPLEHVLLHGPPGLGKTTLAHIISTEMGVAITRTSGPALDKPKDLVGILSNLEEAEVLFIDEIHRLPHSVEEFLYSAMEDFEVHILAERGAFARTLRIPTKRFTLVGATTRAGLLTAPLRDRFGLLYHLDFYPPEELALVVRRSASLLEISVSEETALEIARRSRGTPRIANRLLRRVRDYAQVKGGGVVTRELAAEALDREGIDGAGLDRLDRAYLSTIIENYKGGPVGIEALAATLNEESDTIVDVVEPYLLKIGFLQRTSGGRRASAAAAAHLELTLKEKDERQQGRLL